MLPNWDDELMKNIPGTPQHQAQQEDDTDKYNIHLLNQEIQRIILSLPHFETDEYKRALEIANRPVVQSSVLALGYINNYENKEVLASSIIFALTVFSMQEEKERDKMWLQHLSTIIQRSYYSGLHPYREEFERLEHAIRNSK